MIDAGHDVYVASQTLYEFWVVATRPVSDNGIGMEVVDASSRITKLQQQFDVLFDRTSCRYGLGWFRRMVSRERKLMTLVSLP